MTRVISYPKSGRTWLRLLVGHYLVAENSFPEQDAIKCEALVNRAHLPKISFTHDNADWNSSTVIPYDQLPTNKTQYKQHNVIFLHRNIKDTLVSSYFQATKRDKIFKGTLSEFVRNRYFGAKKIFRFNQIWFENQNVPNNFMSLSYEEMHDNTSQSLSTVMRFLGKKRINSNAISVAVEKCSFENMKQAELNNTYESVRLRPGNVDDPESFKLRKGKINGYVDYLTEDDITYIDKIIKEK
jgi:hypothetical protein